MFSATVCSSLILLVGRSCSVIIGVANTFVKRTPFAPATFPNLSQAISLFGFAMIDGLERIDIFALWFLLIVYYWLINRSPMRKWTALAAVSINWILLAYAEDLFLQYLKSPKLG